MAMKVFRIAKYALFGLVGAIALILVIGVFVMWLWNWLMPDIFGLKTITIWQAWGLLLLAHLLLGAGHRTRNG